MERGQPLLLTRTCIEPMRSMRAVIWHHYAPMRVFALSDVHADYEANARWLAELSTEDYRDDVLVLAGDVSDSLDTLEATLRVLARRFDTVAYVPGNHDLWVRGDAARTSMEKFAAVHAVAAGCGVATAPVHREKLSIVPLLGWYD